MVSQRLSHGSLIPWQLITPFHTSQASTATDGPLHPEIVVSRHFDSELISCTLMSLEVLLLES
jgi:hypothetical protein